MTSLIDVKDDSYDVRTIQPTDAVPDGVMIYLADRNFVLITRAFIDLYCRKYQERDKLPEAAG